MKKLKNLKARLLSLSLAFAMVLSLAMGMAPMKVQAAEISAGSTVDIANLQVGDLVEVGATINVDYYSKILIDDYNSFCYEKSMSGDEYYSQICDNLGITGWGTYWDSGWGDSEPVPVVLNNSYKNGAITTTSQWMLYSKSSNGEYRFVSPDNLGGETENPPAGDGGNGGSQGGNAVSSISIISHAFDEVIADIQDGTLVLDLNNYWPVIKVLDTSGVENDTWGNCVYLAHPIDSGWQRCTCRSGVSEHGVLLQFEMGFKLGDDKEDITDMVSIDSNTLDIAKAWYDYSIYPTNGAINIVIVPKSSSTPTPPEVVGVVIDEVNVQVDWNKVPALVEGSREVPEFDEIPANIEGNKAHLFDAIWGVKVDESFLITEEDDYFEAMGGETGVANYNAELEGYLEVYGWAPLEFVISNPYYTINNNDTYVLFIGVQAGEGYTFGGSRGGNYEGEIISNLTVGCKLINDDYSCQLALGLELGKLSDIIQSKNEASGTQTPAPTPSTSTPSTSTPSTAPITVPVSNGGNDNVLKINASLSGETAKVNELTAEEIDKVAKNETKDSIEINLSETGKTVKEAALPVSSLNEIARIMDDPSNKLDNVTIKLSTATVEISEHALKAVLSKTTGNDLRLVVDDVHKDTLNNTQKESVKNQNVHMCIDAYFISNGVRIGDFQGGTATIRLPFNVPAGLNGNGFSVWYVGDDGTIEKHDTRYVNGELVFTVSHFSDYVVVYDGAVKDNVPKTGEVADYTTLVWTSILAIGVLGLVLNRQKRRQ